MKQNKKSKKVKKPKEIKEKEDNTCPWCGHLGGFHISCQKEMYGI